MTKATVVLAEDHDLVRAGFKSILDLDGTVEVIAEAQDGEMAILLTQSEKPDILIVDLSMPKLSGMAVISKLKKTKLPTKIFVLTAAEGRNVWNEVLELGVSGLALKSISQQELILGIRKVLANEVFIHSEIKPSLGANNEFRDAKHFEDGEGATNSKRPKLSIREKQVIKLVAEGHKTKEIAELLEISDRTVSKHRENIMMKLDMEAAAELVNYASHIGLLKVQLDEIR